MEVDIRMFELKSLWQNVFVLSSPLHHFRRWLEIAISKPAANIHEENYLVAFGRFLLAMTK